ncbi:hypothetical protein [Nocardiopsis lambiniae]|uniref:Uncharacterized protein n=1 Tax=Nocardiopsis lambiniae TaxID=3075539 RepID=A0ABU2MGU5_9ACTN|nr:hypothetical protein [Nocardiopsis sp. DSM 44743]MDT0331921.1 hypothetical protein [Nocardiopsis sp. DSM 44743]
MVRTDPASVYEALLMLQEGRRDTGERTTGWEWPIAQPTLCEVIASLEMVYDLAEGTAEDAEAILYLVRTLRTLRALAPDPRSAHH